MTNEFIEKVEAAAMWDDIEPETYREELAKVGLDYDAYDDPDTMWNDYLDAMSANFGEEMHLTRKERKLIELWRAGDLSIRVLLYNSKDEIGPREAGKIINIFGEINHTFRSADDDSKYFLAHNSHELDITIVVKEADKDA